MNVLIVDDHALFRHGLALTLSELFDAPAITEAGSADQAIELLGGEIEFDLALVDLVMPGMNGFEGIKLLHEQLGTAPVVVVSSSDNVADIKAAFDCGARGYVLKSSAAEVLQHALPLILAGEVYMPAIALNSDDVMAAPAPLATATVRVMTPRQLDVLTLLAKGQSNKEIARNLNMVDSTVKVHVKAILQKLGVKNRTQAAIAGMQQGYITDGAGG
jgi:DNA-binding NarL/FixJ family response regulator